MREDAAMPQLFSAEECAHGPISDQRDETLNHSQWGEGEWGARTPQSARAVTSSGEGGSLKQLRDVSMLAYSLIKSFFYAVETNKHTKVHEMSIKH